MESTEYVGLAYVLDNGTVYEHHFEKMILWVDDVNPLWMVDIILMMTASCIWSTTASRISNQLGLDQTRTERCRHAKVGGLNEKQCAFG